MAQMHEGFLLEPRDDGWSVVGYQGAQPHLAVPAQVDGRPVVLVAARAFEGNPAIASAEVPESVTFIGNYAFASCAALEKVVLHARIESLNLGTFWNCTALVDVQLPQGLRNLNDGAFRGCTALQSLDVPRSVSFIGDSVFRECTGLKSIVLDGQIETIERSAFRDCANLSSVAISTTLAYLGTRVFQDCPALFSVALVGQASDAVLTAFKNHGFLHLVADYAIERQAVPFNEARTMLASKDPAQQLFAARVLASYPDMLDQVFSKQKLARTLAGAGRTAELRVLEEHGGFLDPSSLPALVEAANQAGHTATAAYLLDLFSRLQQDAPPSEESSLRL